MQRFWASVDPELSVGSLAASTYLDVPRDKERNDRAFDVETKRPLRRMLPSGVAPRMTVSGSLQLQCIWYTKQVPKRQSIVAQATVRKLSETLRCVTGLRNRAFRPILHAELPGVSSRRRHSSYVNTVRRPVPICMHLRWCRPSSSVRRLIKARCSPAGTLDRRLVSCVFGRRIGDDERAKDALHLAQVLRDLVFGRRRSFPNEVLD
jgi:hypothetical protein